MDPYTYALREAAHNLFQSLGTLDDLGSDLANTVANVYYKYALVTGTVSNLALALGTSQRTVQRALDSLAEAGKVQSFGRGRARRWLTPPVPGFTTTLLLPAPLPID